MQKHIFIIVLFLTHYSYPNKDRANLYKLIVYYGIRAREEERRNLANTLYYLTCTTYPTNNIQYPKYVLEILQEYELASKKGRVYPGVRRTAQYLQCYHFDTSPTEFPYYYLLDATT